MRVDPIDDFLREFANSNRYAVDTYFGDAILHPHTSDGARLDV
ncbi:hypothetical protein [Phyllobacterium endophyticum]|nr:hypothetical protein [Phyllobacterium endophyticum]